MEASLHPLPYTTGFKTDAQGPQELFVKHGCAKRGAWRECDAREAASVLAPTTWVAVRAVCMPSLHCTTRPIFSAGSNSKSMHHVVAEEIAADGAEMD